MDPTHTPEGVGRHTGLPRYTDDSIQEFSHVKNGPTRKTPWTNGRDTTPLGTAGVSSWCVTRPVTVLFHWRQKTHWRWCHHFDTGVRVVRLHFVKSFFSHSIREPNGVPLLSGDREGLTTSISHLTTLKPVRSRTAEWQVERTHEDQTERETGHDGRRATGIHLTGRQRVGVGTQGNGSYVLGKNRILKLSFGSQESPKQKGKKNRTLKLL